MEAKEKIENGNFNFRSMTNHQKSGSCAGHRYSKHGHVSQGGIGGNFAENNIPSGSYDHTDTTSTRKASTIYEGNDVVLSKGQAFTKEEYRHILNMIYRDATELSRSMCQLS